MSGGRLVWTEEIEKSDYINYRNEKESGAVKRKIMRVMNITELNPRFLCTNARYSWFSKTVSKHFLKTACSLGAYKKRSGSKGNLYCGGIGYDEDDQLCRLVFGTPKKEGEEFTCRHSHGRYTFWIPVSKDDFNPDQMKFQGQLLYIRDHSNP